MCLRRHGLHPAATAGRAHRSTAGPGTRPELTPTEAFYRIDINLGPPQVDGQRWELVADGRFARPRRLSLADLQAFPEVTQPITLSCISNPIGGDLISTSRWTGARLRDVVEDLGLQPDAQALRLEAADGFYEYVTMDDLLDPRTLLVYGMDGATLPVAHGYPLRIYIPNRYGMKQPKWITHVEAVGQPGPGYWVERGWSAEAHPQIITIIDPIEVNAADEANLLIGGIAWAGDRGIRQVEVQVDEGAWAAASLLTPPLGPLTWELWRYDWPRQPGRHTFRARATDGTGATQVGEHSGPHPDGATGYHTLTVTI
ncbi:MAG: molybdopterin-dependent oxidoreductase [Chloroflexales bacterium]|nr:molybdopterin-dependent oxidoreductase [Chloroflexales bacterium]